MAARTGQLALLLLLAFLCGTHALAQGSSGEDTHFDFPMEDPDDDRNTTLMAWMVQRTGLVALLLLLPFLCCTHATSEEPEVESKSSKAHLQVGTRG
ncbi:hypothetical protein T484DRAFT_1834612 [Baffinella frigidus]|nr:hypothetical protein T484DRAFT_1834612 [Cryptophyta sp. CCMP2293]